MLKKIIPLVTVVLLLVGCKKNVSDPTNDADHAAITTITLQFSQAGVVKKEVVFNDPDGVGGANPIRFDSIKLDKNQVYNATIILENKSAGATTVNMNSTIKSAGHQHEFFYIPEPTNLVTVEKLDKDNLGFPLGFDTRWTTPNTPAQGTTKIMLRHIVFGKTASNPPTIGHADIEIIFATIVQ
jgi:hypothetical protein